MGGNASLAGQSIVLQRIPAYTSVAVNGGGTLTASPFNGTLGGIVAFVANGAVTISGAIAVDALGYRGGAAGTTTPGATTGGQGESFPGAGTRANTANGGGGGGSLSPNGWAGGGGGAGYGSAGTNGNDSQSVGGPGGARYGIAPLSKIYLGSGGGAGGSILILGDTLAIGNNLITATAGAGGTNDGAAGNRGPGAVGRIAVGYTTSLTGTANPGVSVIPQPPVANNDSYKIGSGVTLNVAPNGVLGNDSGAPTAAVLNTTTANGALTFNADGSFSYAPQPGFVGVDSFSYHATSDNGSSGTATVQISVFLAQAMIKQAAEPAGPNCANGGISVASGLDSGAGGGIPGDGILQDGEIASTAYICNGTPGTTGPGGTSGTNGLNALALSTLEAPGNNCAAGGERIDAGIDANADGTLQQSEISSTFYVRNGTQGDAGANGAAGTNGVNGSNSIVTLSDEPTGSNCAYGGKKVEAGVDLNNDATLTSDEVTSTAFICNGETGAAGKNGLAQVTPEPAGSHCKGGGQKIETGTDWNGNGTLEGAEITSTAYVCSGQDGSAALAGYNSLLSISDEAPGANCANGGKKVQSGWDKDGNGTLDASEVQNTAYICNGAAGSDGKSGSAGADGKRLNTGYDTNGNGTLDAAEILNTSYLCNATVASGSSGGGCTASPRGDRTTPATAGLLLAGLGALWVRRRRVA